MSQNVLERHRERAERLRYQVKTVDDVDEFWFYEGYDARSFLEVYDELERWYEVLDKDHAVGAEFEEFTGNDFTGPSPVTIVFFLAWLEKGSCVVALIEPELINIVDRLYLVT